MRNQKHAITKEVTPKKLKNPRKPFQFKLFTGLRNEYKTQISCFSPNVLLYLFQ